MPRAPKKAAMRPKHPAHPGVELDAHGNLIPMEARLAEDRAKARSAAKRKRTKTAR